MIKASQVKSDLLHVTASQHHVTMRALNSTPKAACDFSLQGFQDELLSSCSVLIKVHHGIDAVTPPDNGFKPTLT